MNNVWQEQIGLPIARCSHRRGNPPCMHCALRMHQKPPALHCLTPATRRSVTAQQSAAYKLAMKTHTHPGSRPRSLRTVQRPTSLLTRRHRPHLLLLRRRVNLQNAEAERAGRGGGRETEVEGESEYEKEGDADNKEITEATERGIKRHAAAQRERALAPHR